MQVERQKKSKQQGPRVTIVTLDRHLAASVSRAQQTLAADVPGLSISLHAATEWAGNPGALQDAISAVSEADIIVCCMMFIDDQVQAILPTLRARRDTCTAMLCCVSSAEIVALTKMGKLDMTAEQKGPMALLKKLRGKPNKKESAANAGAGQMAMLRRLPKILRFIPGTAQDLRIYFLMMQYWLSGSDENVANMLKLMVSKYIADSDISKVPPPVEYPEVGVYHPALPDRVSEAAADLPAGGKNGTIGLLLIRSYVLANDARHYDGAIAAFEAKGLRVIPAFASGLDQRPAIEKYFLKDGHATVDAVVSLTGFSLVGGPAYNIASAAEEIMARVDVPLIAAHALEFQTLEEWNHDGRGLSPIEATIMVAIPEIDGATGPTVFGGRSSSASGHCEGCERQCGFDKDTSARDMIVCAERVESLAARVAKVVRLKRSQRAERRVAITLFNFPPNAGATGTAAYLSVFESLFFTLRRLQASGYNVEVPDSVDALRERVLGGNAESLGQDANVHARVSADEHVRREPYLQEIESEWGPAPGSQLSFGGEILVLGERFGNVFVGIQPSFGYEGDPMRLLFAKGFAPTHAFSAFYRWIREDFDAHAVLHFGTHGALEFMPGKQTGLSGTDWPDRLIGDLPNLYLYAANNPSEGSLAKRRSNATLVSYMTPPLSSAGLYKGLVELKATLERWRAAPPDAERERGDLLELMHAQAAEVDLAELEHPWEDPEAEASTLAVKILEMEYELIPQGLHIVGQPPSREGRIDMLSVIAETAHGVDVTHEALGALVDGEKPQSVSKTSGTDVAVLEKLAETDRLMQEDGELTGLINALDAKFTRPAPGGDIIRTPDVLPTGRNVHGFDPFRIPSAFAMADGKKQAQLLIETHMASGAAMPRTIALVLWGADNLKSEGGPIAQALCLMGAKPRFDGYGRICGAELVSLEELGRPRIDVMATLSGIFRDLLPLQTRLLAEAAWLAASAEEPAENNFIRANALAHAAKTGCDLETAALRVFSNADGAYGANVNLLVDSGAWNEEEELANAYTERKCFAYGRDGVANAQPEVLQGILEQTDLAYQNLESVELGVTTVDHYFDTLGGIGRAVKSARGESAPTYIGDQTRGEGKVRTLAAQVTLETRTRTLNPKWFEGMLNHGPEGVRQIEAQLTNTVGWSATTGEVEPWVYQRMTETFVLDENMRNRLADLNPKASMRMANRLIEAYDRKYWSPDSETLDALMNAGEELEDRLEGIVATA